MIGDYFVEKPNALPLLCESSCRNLKTKLLRILRDEIAYTEAFF